MKQKAHPAVKQAFMASKKASFFHLHCYVSHWQPEVEEIILSLKLIS